MDHKLNTKYNFLVVINKKPLMPSFAIQNTEAKESTRVIKYESATPNAFVIATNFSSPYVLEFTAGDPIDIYCDNILN